MPATVIPFPARSCRARTSGVRVAYVAGRWCVERLAGGGITGRNRMPTRADAERIARRISRRDGADLLPPAKSYAIGRIAGHDHHSPDAA